MIRQVSIACGLALLSLAAGAQSSLTPEQLWKLGRVSGLGLSKDKQYVLYAVSTPDVAVNKSQRKLYRIPLNGGAAVEITDTAEWLTDPKISSDGKHILSSEPVKIKNIIGAEKYPDLPKSNAYVF
ncbi:MAG: hypothetical protein J7576_04985, partial [Siphonobacter aquaeclarae]|nr:hypothetical protein [Siphonobacter aquaeclarae]